MSVTVTTVRSKPKAFAWSYSKIKNFETCPKRYWHLDVAKDVKEEEGEALAYGNTVHAVLAARLLGTPLPAHFKHLEPWADKILKTPGKILTEQKLAINKDFNPVSWFDKEAWYRGIADVIKITGRVALAIDWKTGKIIEDGSQLALMAQCIFSHHPEVERIRTEFVWIKEDATTRADFSRHDMVDVWRGILPRVALLQKAHEAATFPPKPGGLCRKWCPIVSCPHHGV
jgi:hypothetical protein